MIACPDIGAAQDASIVYEAVVEQNRKGMNAVTRVLGIV